MMKGNVRGQAKQRFSNRATKRKKAHKEEEDHNAY
jgi:hypothetical protein